MPYPLPGPIGLADMEGRPSPQLSIVHPRERIPRDLQRKLAAHLDLHDEVSIQDALLALAHAGVYLVEAMHPIEPVKEGRNDG